MNVWKFSSHISCYHGSVRGVKEMAQWKLWSVGPSRYLQNKPPGWLIFCTVVMIALTEFLKSTQVSWHVPTQLVYIIEAAGHLLPEAWAHLTLLNKFSCFVYCPLLVSATLCPIAYKLKSSHTDNELTSHGSAEDSHSDEKISQSTAENLPCCCKCFCSFKQLSGIPFLICGHKAIYP